MKKLFYLAAAITVMASCTSDNLVDSPNVAQNGESGAIVFGSTYSGLTRADHYGADAATLLGNNFVVMGMKSDGTIAAADAPVFDHYNVNWVTNTANTTTSNTSDWEYVAQTKHAHTGAAAQSIKYWDYGKSQYDFIAYSKGTATAVYTGTPSATQVLFSAITPATMKGTNDAGEVQTDVANITKGAYTVKGKASELAKVYIADLVTAYRDESPSDYQNVVNFKFRSLSAKVRLALYETVPGYSIQGSSVKFYTYDKSTDKTTVDASGDAHLYTTGSDVFNEEGTYTVYYPTTGYASSPNGGSPNTDYNKAHIKFAPETGGTGNNKTFGPLDDANKFVAREVAETSSSTDELYIGRSSNEATFAGDNAENYYTIVIPNETGAVLNLKVDYTLISTDGSGEEINVTGATAQVPAVYATWKSGYAYTYIFKISQNTNGLTNPSAGPAGLYPITFDATVVETEDGVQETITTVATPSITTYAKGVVVTANNEYTTGSNIYAVVENGTALTVGSNANLYTVTLEDGAAQTINEASVANAIANGGAASPFVVTDANGKKMTVTAAAGLTAVTEIAAADAPDGNAITVNGAKFTPTAPTCTAVTSGTTLTLGSVYYTSAAGAGRFVSDGTEVADGTNYFTVSTAGAIGTYVFEYIDGSGNKYYKIIKVID